MTVSASDKRERRFALAALMVFLLTAAVTLATLRTYSFTVDEDDHSATGDYVLRYYLSGFSDHQALTEGRWRELPYGTLVFVLSNLVEMLSGLSYYLAEHLTTLLFGLSAFWGTYQLGKRLGGASLGFWSMVLLILSPMFYGHLFNNPKDIPFAAGYVWCLVALFAQRRLIPLAVAAGLTMAIRPAGAVVFLYAAVMTLCEGRRFASTARRMGEIFISAALALALASVPWPWLAQNPWRHLAEALSLISHFTQQQGLVIQQDRAVHLASALPWNYIPRLLLFKSTEFEGFLLIAASVFALAAVCRKPWPPRQQVIGFGLVVFSVIYPMAYAAFRHTILYDQGRHFLFVIPPLCVCCAAGLVKILQTFSGRQRWLALALLFAILLGDLAAMIRLHPYQYIYFNRFAGGLRGGFKRYGKLDYWGHGIYEAQNLLQSRLRGKDSEEPEVHVYLCTDWDGFGQFAPVNFAIERDFRDADYGIGPPDCLRGGEPLGEIRRDGVVLQRVAKLTNRNSDPTGGREARDDE